MFKPLAISLAIAAAFPVLAHAQEEMARVNVTGSNIRVSEKEGASAVQVITAKEMKASGKTSIADVLRSISANSGNSYNEQFTGSFSAGTAGLSLRGIGQKNTLILVNGKRVASYATAQNLQETFVDLNSLPMAAVQRIEVLKDGASSIYGSDAVAGVVNIILYQEFTGTELTVQGGSSTEGTGQHEKSAALQTGFGKLQEDGYSVVFSVDAQQRDKLQQSDVAWMRDSDYRNQQRGALAWVPTNYAGSDPTKVLGGPSGPLQWVNYGDITPGKTGQVLAYNPAPYKTLIPGIQRIHSSLRTTIKVNEDTEAYVDLLYSYSRADQTFSAPLTVNNATRAWNNGTQSLDTINVALPVGNPYNPGSTPLPFTATLFDLGPRMKQDKVTFYRTLAGLKGTKAGWDWDASVGHSSSKLEETVQNFVNRYAFQTVLANGSYNFFDTAQNSEAVRNSLRLSTLRPAVSTLDTLDFSASRELWQLPAGPLGFAAGAQWRREKMDSQTSTAVLSGTELRPAINIIDGSRDVSALFAEFNVPVVKDLSLNLASRADHYSDFGNAFSPKASARYQAAPWLLLRGTLSRAFRAPSLPEITNSTAVSYGSVIDAKDPVTPTQLRGVTVITAANPALRPERSKNLNLGLVISPTASSSIGIDYYRIKQDGVIGTESSVTTLANEAIAPQKITRDSAGRITTLYRQYRNQGQREVSGIDLDLRQRFTSADWGKLTLAGQLSRVLRFAEPLSDGAPLTDGAGTNYFGSIPKWRGVSSATWEQGKWSSTLTWTYVGSYAQSTHLDESVAAFSTFDVSTSWQVTPAASVSFIVQNLADKRAPWDYSATGFDYTQADPRGRFASLKLNYKF
ncbi:MULTISPECIES: TonB-dependent receptor [unclassified Janthinobacterium]|uniref:TonB-dependent receptor n=1 Tax=unclassified Janthinobacterium TaxID=2610881 RepID=UPI0016134B31|nr:MULTISPECIES: TonB-dependent receptor [unclassified Janthinobacterium]MBB5605950.1 iron complex outermembrane receptor protein [Janthinobacterium sp. S3T4]MBB5611132.1 iron complex outermembrane receptor protein [Janthinobacterium sp. S3M3]